MHELSLVQSLLARIEEWTANQPPSRLRAIHLAVGEFSGVEPALMEIALQDTLIERNVTDVTLHVSMVPLRARCECCDQSFEVCDFEFACPVCGQRQVEVISGQELILERIEVEELA